MNSQAPKSFDVQPTLVVAAGPNGSGKTSLLRQMNSAARIIGEWINPDEIAQADFGGWNDPKSILLAAEEAERRRIVAVRERRDFTFETVLSTQEKLNFVADAKASGYFIRAYFTATESPTINASRVMNRWLEGGHSVPLEKIASRYYRSIANLIPLVALADIAQVFDNSKEGQNQHHIMSFVRGHLHKLRVAPAETPIWCNDILKKIRPAPVSAPDVDPSP